jgi:hypothetical protein
VHGTTGLTRPAWALWTPQHRDDDLKRYRDTVALVWSSWTIYERFRQQDACPWPQSTGQCGVTSAWLSSLLAKRHALETFYCHGNVLSMRGGITLADHCWLEVHNQDDDNWWVIDITCDQSAQLREQQVLCETHDRIAERWAVRYESDSRKSAEELANDPVQSRVEKLVTAVGPERMMDLTAGAWHLF